MELGALICTPRSPQCHACPVHQICVAQSRNLQEQLPNLSQRPKPTALRFIAFVAERDGKFLVRQRPDGVVNAHLWEFPNVEVQGAPANRQRVHRSKSRNRAGGMPALPGGDFRLTSTKPLCTVKHAITRYRITVEAFPAEVPDARTRPDGQWLTRGQLRQLAFTSAHKKILDQLGKPR
jgi:A/G-specific adenine glycosylase